jgi:hypothetical protein
MCPSVCPHVLALELLSSIKLRSWQIFGKSLFRSVSVKRNSYFKRILKIGLHRFFQKKKTYDLEKRYVGCYAELCISLTIQLPKTLELQVHISRNMDVNQCLQRWSAPECMKFPHFVWIMIYTPQHQQRRNLESSCKAKTKKNNDSQFLSVCSPNNLELVAWISFKLSVTLVEHYTRPTLPSTEWRWK